MADVITSPKGSVERPVVPHSNQQAVHRDQRCPKVSSRRSSRLWRVSIAFVSWFPAALVIAGLSTLAWYGHHNAWKLPSFGLIAESPATPNPEWCDAHGVPEAECINCIPGLIEDPPTLAFCKVHGVHGCVLENPTLAETKTPVEVTPSDLLRAERALAIRPRRENLALSQLPGSRIQFASVEALRSAGVDVEPVVRKPIVESLQTACEVRYNATKTAQVSPPADGIVKRVLVDVGDWVEAGQVLALVDSEKVGQLKSVLLAALSAERLKLSTMRRIEPLANRDVIPGKLLLESQAELEQAAAAVDRSMRSLSNLGLQVNVTQLRAMTADQAGKAVRDLGTQKISDLENSDNIIAVEAPLDGRVVIREAVVGEVVSRGTLMFQLTDTRTMWLDLRVPAEESSLARIGQHVRFRPDGQATVHRGTVSWISSGVDRQTRTVRVRAELANRDGELRNEAFGLGEIVLRDEPEAIVVPDSSVQWDGDNTLVFVRDARFFNKDRPKFFIARSVRVGISQNGFTEIIAGVLPGEVVASSGSDVLRAQLLKSNLGAGCTCGH